MLVYLFIFICAFFFFFFQAEDGIRDRNVTGVQTCALPILTNCVPSGEMPWSLLQRVANPVSRICGMPPATAIFSMRPFLLKSRFLPSGIQLGASNRSGAT